MATQSPSPPAVTALDEGQPQTEQSRPPIRTYHCSSCNYLLLATTRDLSRLPRRREPALDRAMILPLPPQDPDSESDDDEDSQEEDEPRGREPKPARHWRRLARDEHFSVLLSSVLLDRKQIVIRRHDGFETRLLYRCGRCRVVLGYALDAAQFGHQKHMHQHSTDEDTTNEHNDIEGKQQQHQGIDIPEVVYLLPGAFVETEDMGGMGTGEQVAKGGGADDVLREADEEWMAWERLVTAR